MTHSISSEFPRSSLNIILSGLQEIIGKTALLSIFDLISMDKRLLTQSDSSIGIAETKRLETALSQKYGQRGGSGIILRAGRSSFKYYLNEYGSDLKFDELEFRLLPQNRRISEGLKRISEKINQDLNVHIGTTENSEAWIWTLRDCPECTHSETQDPNCQFIDGFLQDYLAWSGNGKLYPVNETECKKNGDAACVFQMGKKPLE